MPQALFQLPRYLIPVAAAQWPSSVAAYLQNSQPGMPLEPCVCKTNACPEASTSRNTRVLAAAAACVRAGQPAHRQLLISHSVAAARSLPVSASASRAFAAEKPMACHH